MDKTKPTRLERAVIEYLRRRYWCDLNAVGKELYNAAKEDDLVNVNPHGRIEDIT